MQLDLILEGEREQINNFNFAQAIHRVCSEMPELDATTVCRMIMAQVYIDDAAKNIGYRGE